MRRYYLIAIIFLSLTSHSFPQDWSLIHIENNLRHSFIGLVDTINNKESRTIMNKTVLDNGFLLTEELWQDWSGSEWINDWRFIFIYDGNDNKIEEIRQDWDNVNWVNLWREVYIYDGNNIMLEDLWQDWDGSNWVNYLKWIYTYNGSNIVSGISEYEWDGSNWVNAGKTSLTYDGNYNMIELFYQVWDDSNWVNATLHTYTYDVNNNRVEWLRQLWIASIWENIWKYTYTYIGNNRTEQLRQNWGATNWMNDRLLTYIYDVNDNNIHNYWFEWDSTYWLKDNLYSHTYDINNKLIQTLGRNWVGLYWENDHKITIAYDGNYIFEELYEHWDGSDWYFHDRITFNYIITGIEQLTDVIKSYNLSTNFPNPFNPTTTINYQLPELSFVTLKVYDVLGSEVVTLVSEEKPIGNYEVEFDGSVLTSGIYFYQLKAGNFIQSKKMVLMK